MSSCVYKILFKSEQICGCCCKMLRGSLFWDTRYDTGISHCFAEGYTQEKRCIPFSLIPTVKQLYISPGAYFKIGTLMTTVSFM